MGIGSATPALLLLGIYIGITCAAKPYKLCSLPGTEKDCAQLQRTDEIDCINNFHGIDCILNIEYGRSDFGRVTPEEALVAANYVQNVVVVGEFRSDIDDSIYATVVLIKSDHTDGFKGLKGKKYCHPGFKFEETVTGLVLKEFENTVLKDNGAIGCNNKVDSGTLLEKELKALSDFFGPSCRPGPWIDLDEPNQNYYKKYKSLCEICSPSNECNVPNNAVPFLRSLDCLVNGGGDVAVTTLNTIHEFFNKTENLDKQNNYKYLCRNGSVSALNNPCIWSKQPVDLIIAHRDQAETIKTELEHWVPKQLIADRPTPYEGDNAAFLPSLETVLFPPETQYDKIKLSSERQSLKDFLEKYRVIPKTRDVEKCPNTDIKWCTTSDTEQQKCVWLAQAALNNGFQPVLSCVQSPSKLTCLEDIKKDKADVVAADAHHGYIARKKSLAPLAYPETDKKQLINTVVVIKASNELGIERFENLKTRKACIPEYGGIEWLSFINAARDKKALSKTTCDYGELISDFVGDSCMPGAHDAEHEKSAKTDSDKLCSLCIPVPSGITAKTCNSDETNAYYGNLGALKCLKENGDFAVITLNNEGYPNFNENEFRILCKNGSLTSNTGFNVDSNCVLTTIVDSEVVSKRDNPKNNDISITLLNFERRFGTDRTKAFEVFNIFNDTVDLLFKDTTVGLAATTSTNKNIRNYVSLFEHVDKCVVENDGNSAATKRGAIVLPILLNIILFIMLKD